ncbi:MAG: outer membrane protein [Ginsengibacter sp.]
MNKFIFLFRVSMTVIMLTAATAYGQTDSQKVILQKPIQQNAGFDVIVKTNGDIVYGLVKEVGPYFISYQRTDIPDGPIYTIPRNEVYVISYRNQVKDYITPVNDQLQGQPYYSQRFINYKKDTGLFKYGVIRIQFGFLRSFTKVKDVKSYSSSGSFPVVSVGYEVLFKHNLNLGVQIGFGSHNFSTEQFSAYDSTQTNVTLKENIFALYVYGRYYLLQNTSPLQPYIAAGLGITSSNIISNNKISFTNDNSQVILVKSGQRSTGLGLMARVGAEYFISNQFQVSLDAGYGLSVINAGVAFTLK